MKTATLVILIGLIAAISSPAWAYFFIPSDSDIQDLPHEKYFKWGINFSVPSDQVITSARITFHDIYNWENEPNDRLWLHLLDNANLGLSSGTDNEAPGTWFAPPQYTAPQILLNEFADLPEGYAERQDVVYEFDNFEMQTLTSYALNGRIGIGFDPDCHYYNCGVDLRIETEPSSPPVPEPATAALLGIGLIGTALAVRKRAKKS